jgi:hypothetical protein
MALKRKRNDLTIQQKFEILEDLKSSPSVTTNATKCNIDPNTVSKIKSKALSASNLLVKEQLFKRKTIKNGKKYCYPTFFANSHQRTSLIWMRQDFFGV